MQNYKIILANPVLFLLKKNFLEHQSFEKNIFQSIVYEISRKRLSLHIDKLKPKNELTHFLKSVRRKSHAPEVMLDKYPCIKK